MKATIDLIDLEIIERKKDTMRGLSKINELLIWLAKIRWDAIKLSKNYKTSYELSIIEKKAEKELELITANNARIERWLEKWEKLEKVTDAELTRYAERLLTKDYENYREQEAIAEYLKPIVEAYVNYVNWIKRDWRTEIKVEKFNPNDSQNVRN